MQKGELFTKKSFLVWLLASVWHSIVTYFFVVFFFANDVLKSNGQVGDLWTMGTIASTLGIIIVNLRMALETK